MSKYNDRIIQEAQSKKLEQVTRRHFLNDCVYGLGGLALGSLFNSCGIPGISEAQQNIINPLAPHAPHFLGKAKSVIYLHMAGEVCPHTGMRMVVDLLICVSLRTSIILLYLDIVNTP
jgi:hypothetical protein